MAKTFITAAILATTTLSANAQGMQEAVQQALANHPNITSVERNRDAIGHEVRIAKGGYLPTVDFTAATGWERTKNNTTINRPATAGGGTETNRDLWRNESRLTIRQNIYNGFATRADVAEQKNRFTSAKFNVLETKEITALDTLEAYLNVLRARELVALGIQNLQTHEQYLNQISQRVAAGRGSQANQRQAEGRAALARSGLISFQGDLRNAEADYLELVGNLPKNLSKDNTPFNLLPGNLESALDRAIANHPAIHSAQHDIKAAHAAIQEAKGNLCCPRLDLEGDIGKNRNLDGVEGINNDYQVLLRASYNLYNGGRDKARVEELVDIKGIATASLEQTRRLVEENMMLAWSSLQTSKTRLQPLNSHVQASLATRNAYQKQFEIGQRTLLDLLDSEIELFESSTSLINGKFAVDLSAYEVLANSGDLVSAVTNQQVAAK